MKKKTTFEHGDLNKIAAMSGLSKQHVSNALNGRRKFKPHQAEKLVKSALELGYHTSVFDWLFPQQSALELFKKWQPESPEDYSDEELLA